jgi:predicted dehydrogenase
LTESEGPDRLNLVFLGCGAITATHSRTLRAFSREVRCFYASRQSDRAMAFERRFRGAGSFGSYAAALADGRMDVAFVATPPDSHLELVLRALEQGKDVIVEKPAFPRAEDFDRVAEARARSGRRVLVGENYCYKPLARTLRELLASRAVGRTLFVQVNALKEQPVVGWRAEGGGALLEGGIHWIDLLAHLGPAVRTVHGFRPGAASGFERSMLVVLEYEDGSVATLQHSWETPSPLRGLQLSRIRGSAGSVLFESNGLFVLVDRRGAPRLILPGLADLAGYRAMFRDFIAALRDGAEPLMTLERARADVEIVQAAYGGTDGSLDRLSRRCSGGHPHVDLGDVQGLPA